MNQSPKVGIVVPCYNEEEVLKDTANQLTAELNRLISNGVADEQSFILFVDDGSRDNTWNLIAQLNQENSLIKGLKLAGNVGHQNALYAGLMKAKELVDCAISIDADLQDDISVFEEMIKEFVKGNDIVYGVRDSRQSDTFFKRNTALLFYKILEKLGVKSVYNHADFRLASNRVLHSLSQFQEYHLFLRGIFPAMGYSSSKVFYERKKRLAGESKYPFFKMLGFAWDGITSFSSVPMHLVTITGAIIFIATFLMSCWAWVTLFMGKTIPGWTSTVLPIYFLGGIQIFLIGIIGEYVGKIFNEVKRRPRYIVDKLLD